MKSEERKIKMKAKLKTYNKNEKQNQKRIMKNQKNRKLKNLNGKIKT